MPGRGKGPSRLSVRDLWFGIFAFPTFGGFLLGVPLVGTPEGGEWARFWAVLVIGGFLGLVFYTFGGGRRAGGGASCG